MKKITIALIVLAALLIMSCESPHEHAFVQRSNETEHWKECACGVKTDVAEHTIVVKKQDPTCTEPGYERTSCSECEYTAEKVLEAKGHDFTVIEEKQPTCTEDGQKVSECKVCKTTKTEVIKATNHNLVEQSRQEPSCKVDGYINYACSNCDYTEKKTLEATGDHNFVKPNKDETYHWMECGCGEQGEKIQHAFNTPDRDETHHWTECECGEKSALEEHKWVREHDASGHWDKCECGEEGELLQHSFDKSKYDENEHWNYCDCGEETKKIQHSYNTKNEEPEEHWEECSCGSIINRVSHSFTDGETLESPTCSKEGKKEVICSCGYKKQESIPATGKHVFSELKTSPTEHWKKCSTCELTDGREAHNFGDFVFDPESKQEKKTCSVCNHPEYRTAKITSEVYNKALEYEFKSEFLGVYPKYNTSLIDFTTEIGTNVKDARFSMESFYADGKLVIKADCSVDNSNYHVEADLLPPATIDITLATKNGDKIEKDSPDWAIANDVVVFLAGQGERLAEYEKSTTATFNGETKEGYTVWYESVGFMYKDSAGTSRKAKTTNPQGVVVLEYEVTGDKFLGDHLDSWSNSTFTKFVVDGVEYDTASVSDYITNLHFPSM